MEETKKQGSMLKTAINYGFITGLIVIIFMLITYLLEVSNNSYINLLTYVFYLGGIIWGSKTYRDINNNGYCTYGQALGVGFLVSLFAIILVSIFTFLIFSADSALQQELIAQGENELIQQYENGDLTLEEFDQATKFLGFIYKPAVISILGFFVQLFISFIISLITSIFIKKEQGI